MARMSVRLALRSDGARDRCFAVAGARGVRLGSEEAQLAELRVVPSGVGDHRPERADRERVAELVVGNDKPSAVRVAVHAMAAGRAAKFETVLVKRSDQLTRGDTARGVHKFTTTEGDGHSIAPRAGSAGIGSPVARRSST